MGELKHILVGTDFSDASEAAIEMARVQARAHGARLTLLHAYPVAVETLDGGHGERRMEIGHEVHEALAALKDRIAGPVEDLHAEVLAADNVVQCLCDYAAQHGVELIVLGARGRSGVKDMLIGSVAERVARHASCSVLLAR